MHLAFGLLVSITGLTMMITGAAMKYGFGNPYMVRMIHNEMSSMFGPLLFVMIMSGIGMLVTPLLKKNNLQSNNENIS